MGLYDKTKEFFQAVFYGAGSILILWGFYILARDYMAIRFDTALEAGVKVLLGAGLLYFGRKG